MSDKQKRYDDLIELGVLREYQRIIALLREYENAECGFGVTHDLIALIKGHNK